MSRIVKIPTIANPFTVRVNDSTYTYKAGVTATVPDEVANIIDNINSLFPVKADAKMPVEIVSPTESDDGKYIRYKDGAFELHEVSGGGGDYQTKSITDAAGYYTTDTVEGALAEVGGSLAGKQDAPAVITTGTNITLADNTEYRLTDVTSLTLAYPNGSFECWLKITTAVSGTITITLPASQYIGSVPTFGNGETWEISIRDGIVVAGKAASAS